VTSILELKGVTKAFGGVVANNNVTLAVPKGTIVGLIGPNGSGKTTLFNSIVGYHPIDAGSIRFDGRELSMLRVAQIARLGLLRTFQQTRIFGKITCIQNMLVSVPRAHHSWWFMLRRAAPQDVSRAEELLQFVGLFAKRFLRASDLSFGQQKLLELAMALMNQPQLLLLDEPTAGINPTLINGLMNRLRRANRELGITLVVIEHNMRVIMNLAEYVYCLAHGELLAEGEPEQIRKDRRVIEAYLGAH
jgi:branched-chain amino acid transport system ATP-binding protein